MLLLTSFRDSAYNTPAPPDRRTPSYCANLQAPRDSWVQLRTASLVEPTHHVSVCPPASLFFPLSLVLNIPMFSPPSVSSTLPILLFVPFLFLCCFSCLNKLYCLVFHFLLESITSVYLCSSLPADLESTIVCNCSNLTRAPTGNHGNSAPVCKNKTKVQQPLYYYCYCYYATFSNFFFSFQKLLLFFIFFSVHLPTGHYLILYFCLGFFFVFFMSLLSFAVSVIGTPEGLLTNHRCQSLLFLCCAGVCGPSCCCCSVGWKILGTYSSSSSPSVSPTTY